MLSIAEHLDRLPRRRCRRARRRPARHGRLVAPPARRAPLARAAILTLLTLAQITATAALVPAWSGPFTLLAALLLFTAAGLAATPEHTSSILATIAFVGVGNATILRVNDSLYGAAAIGARLTFIGGGRDRSRDWRRGAEVVAHRRNFDAGA